VAPDQTSMLEEIVVTGTSIARSALDSPLSATSLNEEQLTRLTSNSQADILSSVPGIKTEGPGGEVAVNVVTRGLPSGGQYQFNPLMYDGMPVLSTFGLNSSAYDVYYRNDLGLERLEYVRGGVSNLFGPGSVGGMINYITKTGSDRPEAKLQLEIAEEDRARGDFAFSGPAGMENLHYALSGFYRYDEGPIRTGNATEGFQLRGNLQHEFADGSGTITAYGQYIDDQVEFFLSYPLDSVTRNRLRGNDGREVFAVQTSEVNGLSYLLPNGAFNTRIGEGVATEGGTFSIVLNKDFGAGWNLNAKTKYSDYEHRFGFFLDGDGVVNVPETLSQYIANRFPDPATRPTSATFSFVDTGAPVPPNYLLFANRFQDRERPMTDMTADIALSKGVALGGFEHTFTVGGFFSDAKATDTIITTGYLADFSYVARLVDLVVTNPDGTQTIVSNRGLTDAGITYTNNVHEAIRYAVYLADQMESGRWILDVGGRFEKIKGDIRRDNVATFITDSTTPNLSAALRNVAFGNGTFLAGDVDASEWALSGGVVFKATDSLNIYANAARGYFFPEIRAVQFNAQTGAPTTYVPEIIQQAELGVKYSAGRLTGTLAASYVELADRRFITLVNGPGGTLIERVQGVSTESKAIEATFNVQLLNNLSLAGNTTFENHEYTKFEQSPAFVGNELFRHPDFMYNLGLYYGDGRFDASLVNAHTGTTYSAESNLIKLGDHDIVQLDAGYTFDLGGNKARIGLHVFNLFDDDDISDGSPRQGATQTIAGAYFVARPVLPRRITARFTVDF
ncbi:MAG: TonB-dependent receptor domain-containing protein, partial [Steroidobacteraceae bacterium]